MRPEQKIMILFAILSIAMLGACAREQPMACTMDALVCPDGSAVGRVGPNCEFAPCPDVVPDQTPIQQECYFDSDPNRKYVGKSMDECARIRFACEEGMEFFIDDCGCGCQREQERVCTPQEKQNMACTREYVPVCGWFDPQKIQCVRYPCAQTFGNQCEACAHPDVVSTSPGECPQ